MCNYPAEPVHLAFQVKVGVHLNRPPHLAWSKSAKVAWNKGTFTSTSTVGQAGSTASCQVANMAANDNQKLLWNPENVRDVADSIGISLSEEPLRVLAQDVEYRIGQVIIESLRFMRAANRTTLTVQDVSQALKVLDVEPLYGYESTRPLRYGEASLGPGQPLFYIDDEEVDFEKIINAPLPKVPRDMSFTGKGAACFN